MHSTQVPAIRALVLIFLAACLTAQRAPRPNRKLLSSLPHVIVETDLGGDSDDAAALAFFHHLADRREIVLLAVMHNGNEDWGGAAVSVINTYYGRPELPIGTYRTAAEAGRPEYHPLVDPAQPNGPRRHLSYTGPTGEGRWVRLLADSFPCAYRTRLTFPDAVDVYREVLPNAPDESVLIVNGGFLGNLSNAIGRFDTDPTLAHLFRTKVHRMTGAVGGVNTCSREFPNGLAQHVINNPVHPLPILTWLGGPPAGQVYNGPSLMGVDAQFGARLPIDNPVREAYRYKTEIEHGNRGTSLAWRWHIIDVVTGFSTIAWDDLMHPQSQTPYYTLLSPEWLHVVDNCRAIGSPGQSPVPNLQFQGVGVRAAPGHTLADTVRRIRTRLLDDGLYVGPARPWSPEREHLAVTAMFEDGTFGGLDGSTSRSRIEQGRFVVPTFGPGVPAGARLLTEGRRYFEQTVLMRIARLPDVSQHTPSQTSPVVVEVSPWADSRSSTGNGNAPVIQLIAWPGRGWVDPRDPHAVPAPGRPIYRVLVQDHTPGGYGVLASVDLPNVPLGAELTMRVELTAAGDVQCALDGVDVFPTPVRLNSRPPADGGVTQFFFTGVCPNDRFAIDWIMIRPHAGDDVVPDVHVDKAGDVWFSLLKNGDLWHDMNVTEGGVSSHVVELEFEELSAYPGPLRLDWSFWRQIAFSAETHGIGNDHWVYGLRGFPWDTGDEFVLEYRGVREGEQVPPR